MSDSTTPEPTPTPLAEAVGAPPKRSRLPLAALIVGIAAIGLPTSGGASYFGDDGVTAVIENCTLDISRGDQLVPGRDGVIFFNGCQKATFLPQVWAQLPEPRAFLAALKQKARLPVDFWGPNVMIARYEVEKWKESEVLTP
mgnify:CR=1 FL=1